MNEAPPSGIPVLPQAEQTKLPEPRTEQPASALNRLILLLGTPRSGSTWLAAILNSYHRVLYSHEPLSRQRDAEMEALVARIKNTGAIDAEGRKFILRRWSMAHHDCQRPPFFKKDFLPYPPWLQMFAWVFVRTTGFGRKRFEDLFSPSGNKSFDLLAKDINWAAHARSIVLALNPLLLNIVRHPCGVVASLLRGQRLGLMPVTDRCEWFGYHQPLCKRLGHSFEDVQELEDWEFLALDWLAQNVDFLDVARIHPHKHLVVYEDLCRDPMGVIKGVYDFLGWEMGRSTTRFIERSTKERRSRLLDWLQAKHPYFGVLKNSLQSANSWKTELTGQQISRIISIAEALPHFKEYWPGDLRTEINRRQEPEPSLNGLKSAPLTNGAVLASAQPSCSVQLFAKSDHPFESRQPATIGIPFPKAALRNPAGLTLVDADARAVPLQALPLVLWPDGSVKWLLVDFVLDSLPGKAEFWTLGRAETTPYLTPDDSLRVHESAEGIAVNTGAATFHLDRSALLPFARVVVDGKDVIAPGSSGTLLTDPKGRIGRPRIKRSVIEARGPVRATVRLEGTWDGRVPCRFVARLCFFAGTGLARLRLTVHNPNRAEHPRGLWDLGDRGSMLFRDLSLELGLAGNTDPRVAWTAEAGHSGQSATAPDLEIYQDSSGGDNWHSRNHVNRDGRVPCSFRGYRLRNGVQMRSGLRASPTVTLAGSAGSVTAAVPEFWQQFPKALEAQGRTLRVRLFPQQFGDLFELQGGEQKTHTVWLNFAPADQPAGSALDWVHHPASVHPRPESYASAGACAFPRFVPARTEPGDRLASYLQEIITGPNSFTARREVIDEYGWRHFGEVYADHEAAYYDGPLPVISHFNNQYDIIQGALIHYLRTGNPRWFALADPLARHVIDIDIYHTNQDKAQYNGGLFWFTDHYKDAATSTHRTYSRHNCAPGDRSYGGGPSSNHNFTTGLLYYYFLTGNPDARAAVVGLADWVVNMDDGKKNLLGLIDDGPTGSATLTGDVSYHGPGRGSGNSINALLDGWLATGRRAYLDKAESLIRRTVHPADDIAALHLLNVEKRWSYPVFFVVLARYLDLKAEAGEFDFMYAYARASLVHYARWMLENERPYFDHPEELEFPTETWAAQELRKANAMRLAAAYTQDPLRDRLVKRGLELAERAWSDLERFKSRYVARAAALVMFSGAMDHYFRSVPIAPAPPCPAVRDFGTPEHFVPQKLRIRAQLKTVRGLLRAALSLANALNWLRFLRRGHIR
jgi:hypothetical protein